jgi:hypothetical protein
MPEYLRRKVGNKGINKPESDVFIGDREKLMALLAL